MSTGQKQTFGEKYILLDRIGSGGMAEVYRGTLLGNDGFEKRVVIKKLLPEHARNQELVQVFIGEARLAALLQHENIAVTYDFGHIDGHYFLAMEYLFGKDLFTVMQKVKIHTSLFTIQHALLVASKICEGMDYAHHLEDLKNKPLNIIHRDLTPHNIFITYDGKVKIIDFGIAKAEILDNKTKVGMVKGKLSYMSPEQLTGGDIDLRSDIFSIGILLYEMISLQRMYFGDTATIIRKCSTVDYEHLEEVHPNLEPDLYSILHKAIAKKRGDRYNTCAEMKSDIDNLYFKIFGRLESKILKDSIRKLFKDEYGPDKQLNATDSLSKNNTPPLQQTVAYDSLNTTERIISEASQRTHILKQEKRLPKRRSVFKAICLFTLILSFVPGSINIDNNPIIYVPQPIQDKPLPPRPIQSTVEPLAELPTIMHLQIEADKALKENRLMEPENDSAFKYYSDILRLEPDDQRARDGLRLIGDRYAVLADGALAEQNILKAEHLVHSGLLASPDYQRLQALKGHIEKIKQALIQEWYEKATQRLSKNRLTTPADDSAFLYFANILQISPDSVLGRSGMRKIADRYAILADQAYKQFDYEKAELFTRKGLEIAPDHTRLKELKDDLTRSKPGVFFKTLEKNLQNFFPN